MALLLGGASHGYLDDKCQGDGDSSVGVLRRADALPIIVSVTRDRKQLIARLDVAHRAYFLCAAVLLAMFVLFATVLVWLAVRRRR